MPPSKAAAVFSSAMECLVRARCQGHVTTYSILQDPSLYLKKDVERFLWNFLALRTSSGQAAAAQGMNSAHRSTLDVYCHA